MKKENISEIISGINNEFITEAAEIKKSRAPVIKYVSLAACLAVAVIGAVALSQSDILSPPPVNTEDTTASFSGEEITQIKDHQETVTSPATETATGEMLMELPYWDDLKISEKFREVKSGDITYNSQVQEIGEEYILEFISDTEMLGYDIYEDKNYKENAKIYSIKHLNTDCAVAVKIENDDAYYVYVNSRYSPETLGDFVSDLDLKNIVSFGVAYFDVYEFTNTHSAHTRRTYEDFSDSVIWDMLLDDLTVKNTEYNHPYEKIGVSVDIPLLGYKNISFSVTTDGFIITNILDTQKCFFVGTEKTDAFAEYLENNVPYKETSAVYEMYPDKGEEATAGSVPGYNPDEPVTTPAYNPNESVTSPAFTPEWETNNTKQNSSGYEDFVVEETTKS